ncbi:hypothetical protein QL112_006370 [Xenorhabdus griffiniae]|uniref:Uncharacterized protein n=1 Tax=Xenorhabdus griffiniae TaxID=351672 RepID=A0ABY9XL12_9GAMM|nr:hypothetical protein [Xenorhabdus griffiniae]WMV73638.1 hypothetical protein QL128_06365 [Xenorhabdus griffiniae]WNH03318.1 hypothetical protein QL112_006370 [Xenorhabdus griffiniae]
MNFFRRVFVTEQEFNIIKNNRVVGVANTFEEGLTAKQLEVASQFFIFKHINLECLFDDTALPVTVLPGELILITMMDEEGLSDKSSPRITIQVEDVYHFINRMSSPNEICINFYEYSLLTPAYFFNESTEVCE